MVEIRPEFLFVAPENRAGNATGSLGFTEAARTYADFEAGVKSRYDLSVFLIESMEARTRAAIEAGLTPPPNEADQWGNLYERRGIVQDWQRSLTDYEGYMWPNDDEARHEHMLKREADNAARKMNAKFWEDTKAAHPELGIKTDRELLQEARERQHLTIKNYGRSLSVGGVIGAGIGTLGGMLTKPEEALPNLLTIPLGGTWAVRAGLQLAAGSGGEALSRAMGAQETMERVGIHQSTSDILFDVGVAGLLPAGIEIAASGLSAAARALARRGAIRAAAGAVETAPEPSLPVTPPLREVNTTTQAALEPWADNPIMAVRIAKQADGIDPWLQDWGFSAVETRPVIMDGVQGFAPSSARLMELTKGIRAAGTTPETHRALADVLDNIIKNEGVYSAAANVDKDVFKQLRALTKQVDEIDAARAQDVALLHERLSGRTTLHDKLVAEQAAIFTNPRSSQAAKTAALERLETLQKVQAGEVLPLAPKANADARKVVTDKIDKLRPAVEDALARAQNAWNIDQTEKARLKAAKAGDYERAVMASERSADIRAQSVADAKANFIDEFSSPYAHYNMPPGEALIDTVDRVNRLLAKDIDDAAETFSNSIPKQLKDLEETGEIELPGVGKIDLSVKMDNGSGVPMTYREALEDIAEDKELLQGMSSCLTY